MFEIVLACEATSSTQFNVRFDNRFMIQTLNVLYPPKVERSPICENKPSTTEMPLSRRRCFEMLELCHQFRESVFNPNGKFFSVGETIVCRRWRRDAFAIAARCRVRLTIGGIRYKHRCLLVSLE